MKKKKKGKGKKRGPSQSVFQEPILETMRKSPDRALNYKQIAKRIGVTDTQERNQLAQNLNKMKNDGLLREVERGKYRLKHMPAPKLIGRGLMPNPKSGTVTMDVGKAVQDVKAGKIDFKVDKYGIVHASVGKVSFDAEKLNENVIEVLGTLMRLKPASAKGNYMMSVSLNSTMGPGIKIDQKSAVA